MSERMTDDNMVVLLAEGDSLIGGFYEKPDLKTDLKKGDVFRIPGVMKAKRIKAVKTVLILEDHLQSTREGR